MIDVGKVAALLNAVAGVRWDRCVRRKDLWTIYGWYYSGATKSDFVVAYFDAAGCCGVVTSSAEHSAKLPEQLGMAPGGHRDCERVEDVFGRTVERLCRHRPGEPLLWEQVTWLPNCVEASAMIGGVVRRLSIFRSHEQPEYYHFYRNDGREPLVIGPGDFDGAKAFAQRWYDAQVGGGGGAARESVVT